MSAGASSSHSHLFWVACNRCGLSFLSKARLHLTSCGHTFCSQCQTVGQPCYVCNQSAQRLLPIGNSLPQQAKEMFNRNEETLKKLQDRLSFQQLHFNIFLEVLTKKVSELKSRITSKSKHLADRMDELCAVNQSIEKKGLRLKQMEETVERMKSKQVIGHLGGGGRGPLEVWQQGGGEGRALQPRQNVHPYQWESRREALPEFKFF